MATKTVARAGAKTSFKKTSSGTSTAMLPWLGLALLLLIADQFTKVLILGYYRLGDATYVTSFFNIVRVHNTGAAFSFLAVGVGLAALVLHRHRRRWRRVFIVWMLKSHPGQKLFSFALACILGGAIGNVIDRMLHGYVVDFLDFHCGGWHFPGLQRCRQRHHHRRHLPDPGRAAAGAAQPIAVGPQANGTWLGLPAPGFKVSAARQNECARV